MNTNSLLENWSEIPTSLLEKLNLALWVEIITNKPHCTYYLGPFMCMNEAQKAQLDYIEDLEQEESEIISVNLKRHQPNELTICLSEFPID